MVMESVHVKLVARCALHQSLGNLSVVKRLARTQHVKHHAAKTCCHRMVLDQLIQMRIVWGDFAGYQKCGPIH